MVPCPPDSHSADQSLHDKNLQGLLNCSRKVKFVQYILVLSVFYGTVSLKTVFVFCFLFCLFAISWATPPAYGGSQARGLIGAVACQPMPEPQQRGIQAASATYATAHGNAGSLTH